MPFEKVIFKLRYAIAHRSLLGSTTTAPKKVLDRLRRNKGGEKRIEAAHYFDVEFGTDTGGFVYPQDIRNESGKRNVNGTPFYAVPPSLFRQAIQALQLDYEQFSFIDLGCGKGRTLLLACNEPYQRVVGVEFSEELQLIAKNNIARYRPADRACHNVDCVLGDASKFTFPSGKLLVFMWNPFVGSVFEAVMSNLEASVEREPREVFVVYMTPTCRRRLESSSSFEKIWEKDLKMSEEDSAIYRFPTTSETCLAYRFSPSNVS